MQSKMKGRTKLKEPNSFNSFMINISIKWREEKEGILIKNSQSHQKLLGKIFKLIFRYFVKDFACKKN